MTELQVCMEFMLDISDYLTTYKASATQEIGDVFLLHVINESSLAHVVLATINEELVSCVVINEWTHKCPEDREDPRSSHN